MNTAFPEDRYQPMDPIGRDGMSTIYRGRDMQTDRIVAIKVLREVYSDDSKFVAQFQRGAEARRTRTTGKARPRRGVSRKISGREPNAQLPSPRRKILIGLLPAYRMKRHSSPPLGMRPLGCLQGIFRSRYLMMSVQAG